MASPTFELAVLGFPTEPVTLHRPTVTHDECGDEAVTWADTVIDGCIVATPTGPGVIGERFSIQSITIEFPKSAGLTDIKGCRVTARGETYDVEGDPMAFPDDTCPGAWNLHAVAIRSFT